MVLVADFPVQAVVAILAVVTANIVAVVFFLAVAVVVVVWAVTILLYGAPLVPAVVVKAQALHYYHWPPETFWPSDVPHRVLNV